MCVFLFSNLFFLLGNAKRLIYAVLDAITPTFFTFNTYFFYVITPTFFTFPTSRQRKIT